MESITTYFNARKLSKYWKIQTRKSFILGHFLRGPIQTDINVKVIQATIAIIVLQNFLCQINSAANSPAEFADNYDESGVFKPFKLRKVIQPGGSIGSLALFMD